MHSIGLALYFVLMIIIITNEYLIYNSFKRFLLKRKKTLFCINFFKFFTIGYTVLFVTSHLLYYLLWEIKYIVLIHDILCIITIPKLIFFPIFLFENIFIYIKSRRNPKEKEIIIIHSRRRLLENIAWGIVGLPVFATGLKYFTSGKKIKAHYFKIFLEYFPESLAGFRIVHISNLRLGLASTEKIFHELCNTINFKLKPDLIFFTGDFINLSEDEFYKYKSYLSTLFARYGKFTVLNNKSNTKNNTKKNIFSSNLQELIKSTGIYVLDNENFLLNTVDCHIQIVGISDSGVCLETGDDIYRDNICKILDKVDKNKPCFLLCSNPEYWDKIISKKYKADITFSEAPETIIDFLFLGDIAPVDDTAGLYKKNLQYLYVNRGFGTVASNYKLGALPEIAVFDIHKIENMVTN